MFKSVEKLAGHFSKLSLSFFDVFLFSVVLFIVLQLFWRLDEFNHVTLVTCCTVPEILRYSDPSLPFLILFSVHPYSSRTTALNYQCNNYPSIISYKIPYQ